MMVNYNLNINLKRYCYYCGNDIKIELEKRQTMFCSDKCHVSHNNDSNKLRMLRTLKGVKANPQNQEVKNEL